jgi:branched-subunit amino acid aminotransferase/4-amino-4-deoxychorismate lyase
MYVERRQGVAIGARATGDGGNIIKELLLVTAPVGAVLPGTCRKRVLEAACNIGLEYVERPPDPCEKHLWKEIFVCNALRCIQPVRSLRCSPGALRTLLIRMSK